MRLRISILVLFIVILFIIGCGSNQKINSGKLKIVTTTGMIGDAVINIAGDKVELTTLMGPGVDPHLYKTTKGDLDLLYNADIIFYNGLHLEAKMAEILQKMSSSKTTIAVGEYIDSSHLHYPEHFEGFPDPHVWFDLLLWTQAIEKISVVLQEKDTLNAPLYRSNTLSLIDTLRVLDSYIRNQIVQIPEEQRVLVTAHDAFGYFGGAYDIEVKGLQGISTVTEAGLHDVTQMVDMLVNGKIKAVFVESSVSKKAIYSVVEGCKARDHQIIIGGELFSDAMGQPGTPEGTYIGMVRHNVEAIVSSLK